MLRGYANSGQTSINPAILCTMFEPPPLENCKGLTMKLEVKYLFPTSPHSGANFF